MRLLAIYVSIAATAILPARKDGQAWVREHLEPLRHSLDLEGDVMRALAMAHELILPSAGLTHRFNQFQGDLPELKEGQFSEGGSRPPLVFGVGESDGLGHDDFRRWLAEQARPSLRGSFSIAHYDANLRDGMCAERGDGHGPGS